LSMSGCTTAAFSLAPSIGASGCLAFSINAEGGDQHQVVADVQPVDLDDQEVQLGQVRCHPLGQCSADSATNRREAADVPSPAMTGRSPSGSRTARPACASTR
jgi:hypothetical protein